MRSNTLHAAPSSRSRNGSSGKRRRAVDLEQRQVRVDREHLTAVAARGLPQHETRRAAAQFVAQQGQELRPRTRVRQAAIKREHELVEGDRVPLPPQHDPLIHAHDSTRRCAAPPPSSGPWIRRQVADAVAQQMHLGDPAAKAVHRVDAARSCRDSGRRSRDADRPRRCWTIMNRDVAQGSPSLPVVDVDVRNELDRARGRVDDVWIGRTDRSHRRKWCAAKHRVRPARRERPRRHRRARSRRGGTASPAHRCDPDPAGPPRGGSGVVSRIRSHSPCGCEHTAGPYGHVNDRNELWIRRSRRLRARSRARQGTAP